MKKGTKKNKIKKNRTRAKAKGLRDNVQKDLLETIFLLKNTNFTNQDGNARTLDPDTLKTITQLVKKDKTEVELAKSLHHLKKRKAVLEKLRRYQEIIQEIHQWYPPELFDSTYDYLVDEDVIRKIIRKVKYMSANVLTDDQIIQIDDELEPIWREINDLFESEMENPYGRRQLVADLENFLYP